MGGRIVAVIALFLSTLALAVPAGAETAMSDNLKVIQSVQWPGAMSSIQPSAASS